MSHGLETKLAVIKELEHEMFCNQQQLQSIEDQICHLSKQLRQDHNQTHEVARIIERLTSERDLLQDRLDRLSLAYDRTVDEVS